MDRFDQEIQWIDQLNGDEKVAAGSVVAWQGISTTLNELVGRFNEINLSPEPQCQQRFREVHLKKMIVGMLYEVQSCLDYWTGILRKKGLLTDEIKQKKSAFETAIKIVGLDRLKSIRNGIAFHYTSHLSDPIALTETYRMLVAIDIEALRRIHNTAIECGFAMRDAVIDSLSN